MINPELEFYRGIAGRILAMVAQDEDPRVIHDWAMAKLGEAQFDSQETDDVLVWEDSFEFVRELLERAAERSISDKNAMTPPWGSWRKYVDEFTPGMLYLLGGVSGAGKTSYAEVIAEWLAKHGFRVAFFHLELSHQVMMQRRLARHSGVDIYAVRKGMFWDQERYRLLPDAKLHTVMSGEQAQSVRDAEDRIRSWSGGVHYVHASGWSVERVVSATDVLHKAGNADFVIIDYLDKLEDTSRQLRRFSSEFRREADNVEQLKRMAERLQVPVLLLSQLRKDARQARWLSGEQVRGSGEKHEKANVVVMVRRIVDDANGDATNNVAVSIDKNTMGAVGKFQQYMMPGRFLIVDPAS